MAFSRLRTSIGRFVRSVASSPASATVFAVEGVTSSKSAAGEAYSRWTAGAAASFAIAASTSAFLSDDAFSWGWGQYGQLGHGAEADVPLPKRVDLLHGKNIKELKSCGSCNSTAALTTTGEVYTFGCGKDARLGHGQSIDVPNQDIPRLVAGLRGKPVTHIAVGEYHMAAVLENGEVWTFGKNRHGQLGHANPKPGHPGLVEGLGSVKIVKAVCGRQHTLALSEDGVVYGWGDSTLGAVGSGSKAIIPSPVQITGFDERVVDVVCGRDFSLFLTQSGAVFSCGSDSDGQLGVGFGDLKQLSPVAVSSLAGIKVVKLIAGETHVIALTSAGDVYTWGSGSQGQLGHGDRNNLGLPRKLEALEGVKIVTGAAGGAHTLLVDDKGKVYAFGRGRNGQLGRGDHVESVAAYRTLPVELTSLAGAVVTSVSAGENHSLATVKS